MAQRFIWNADKNQKLLEERGVSFGYTYVIPFVIDDDDNFILKTIFPSRKYHKIYGGRDENGT